MYDRNGGTFKQIASLSSGDSFLPDINALGTRIPFVSRANINGQNLEGNRELYFYDGILDRTFQLTNEPSGSSTEPSINAVGDVIAFQSNANINNGNQEENFEIYIANCPVFSSSSQVPTLSEWGLITMATILGFVGLMILRSRNTSHKTTQLTT